MAGRVRCAQCRVYVSSAEAIQANSLQRVCSTACMNLWLDAQRKKRRRTVAKAAKRNPVRVARHDMPAGLRAHVRSRDGSVCRLCGRRGTQVHHIKFRSQGGLHEPSNLILLCDECHGYKAHGEHARVYRQLFRAYVWLHYVECRHLFLDEVMRVCRRRHLLEDSTLEVVRRAA